MTLRSSTKTDSQDNLFPTRQVEDAAKLLNAMSNPQRLLILKIRREGEHSVWRINDRMSLSQSALSRHLAVLRAAGVVAVKRNAQTILYSIESGMAVQILAILNLD